MGKEINARQARYPQTDVKSDIQNETLGLMVSVKTFWLHHTKKYSQCQNLMLKNTLPM